MKIAVIGAGYVGLVSSACFAEFGTTVVCIDHNQDKINDLQNGLIPIYEPGLEDLVKKQTAAKRLTFTTSLAEAMEDASAVFIAVGTPPKDNGDVDMTYVHGVAADIAAHMKDYIVVVNKSTVPVGTAKKVTDIIRKANPDAEFDVCSNPEFLREGAAIGDFMRPDRVVIGTDSPRAQNIMRELYRPLYLNETPMVVTSAETAELIKYAGNAFLATKISFINEIANLCEKTGANVQDVARGIGLDGRIGKKFLHAGPGYGGSCFPKDTQALAHIGRTHGAPQTLVESVVAFNAHRQHDMAPRIITACGGDVSGKRIGILGLSFKPSTDDMREAPSIPIIHALQKAGADITAFDPAAMENARGCLDGVKYASDAYDAAQDADAIVIVTEWNEFRGLDFVRLADIMKTRRLIDLRNIYTLAEMEGKGFDYVSIGRKVIQC